MSKLNVAILFGGRSGEHEISLLSARSVMDNIDREKYHVIPIGITQEGQWLVGENTWQALNDKNTFGLTPVLFVPEPGNTMLYTRHEDEEKFELKPYSPIDIIFPVLHGTFGEDGTLQGLFEMTEIGYVGAGVLSSSTAMDKSVFKKVMRGIGIPVVNDVTFSRKEIEQEIETVVKACEELHAYPLFTKPANMGSSVGINKCRNRQELIEGLKEAAQYDRRVMIEVGLEKPMEVEISVLGNEFPQASVAGEIVPGDEFYTYNDKYFNGVSRLIIPAELPEGMMDSLRDMAVRAYQAIDCAGLARVDFMISQDGNQIWLNELNTMPGFTQISMYSKLWEASGIPYATLITKLIDFALDRQSESKRSIHQYRRRSDE